MGTIVDSHNTDINTQKDANENLESSREKQNGIDINHKETMQEETDAEIDELNNSNDTKTNLEDIGKSNGENDNLDLDSDDMGYTFFQSV